MPIRLRSVDRQFYRFCRTGDPEALGAVFDATAQHLIRIAAWLMGNRQDSEDLLQKTFLTAIEDRESFRDRRRVMPWLIGIMTNHARNLRRERARRAALPSRPEPVADPSAAAADAEFASMVEQVRHTIGGPYAEVLDLHLAQGLNANEIADRLGRPAGTVRTQLVRGLRQLRERLKGGVVAIVAPGALDPATQLAIRNSVFAAAQDIQATTATVSMCSAAVTTGGLVMSKKLLLAVPLALLLLGTAVYLSWDLSPPAPSVSHGGQETVQVTRDAIPTGAAVDAHGLQRQAATATPDGDWIIRGEIMHGSVAPLPSAQVEGRMFTGYRAEGSPLCTKKLVSDANGAFEWATPRPDGPVTLSFVQCRPDTVVLPTTRTIFADESAPQDVMVYVFLKDCTVTGTVTDEDNRPIAAAWVKQGHRDGPTPCDPSGSFRLMTTATYGDTSVTAGAPGFVLSTQTVKVTGRGSSIRLHFALVPAVRLSGRVVDENGAPIPDATIYTFNSVAGAVRSDPAGYFELPHLDPARSRHTLQAEHASYMTLQRSFASDQLDTPCEIVMKRGARITGRVFAPDGRPVSGARVVLSTVPSYHGSSLTGKPAVTGDDGTFEIRHSPSGTFHLGVFAHSCAPHFQRLSVPADAIEVADVLVHLEAGHSVAGRVVDSDGNGLHRIRVTPQLTGGFQQIGPDVYTAADGSFRIRDLPAGRVDLNCFGHSMARTVERGVLVDRSDVTVTMIPPSALAGRVIDDLTGQPIPRFTIRFVRPELRQGERQGHGYGSEWSRGVVFEDLDGSWNTNHERLPAGTVFGVEATADGYGPAVVRRVAPGPDPDPNALVLRLKRAAQVTGYVIDRASGSPIAGARLMAFNEDHPLAGREPPEEHLFAQSDERGFFSIADAPAGQLSLVVQHPGRPPTFDGPFEAPAGAATSRTISVGTGATWSGTAVDLEGAPVAGVRLARERTEIAGIEVPQASVETDGQGRFAFTGLPPARYWLHGSGILGDGSVIVYSKEIEVAAEEATELRLAPAGTAAVHVELVTTDEVPESLSIRIWRQGRSNEHFSLTTSARSLVVRGLPAGDFQVSVNRFSPTQIISGHSAVTLVSGETARARVPITVRKR